MVNSCLAVKGHTISPANSRVAATKKCSVRSGSRDCRTAGLNQRKNLQDSPLRWRSTSRLTSWRFSRPESPFLTSRLWTSSSGRRNPGHILASVSTWECLRWEVVGSREEQMDYLLFVLLKIWFIHQAPSFSPVPLSSLPFLLSQDPSETPPPTRAETKEERVVRKVLTTCGLIADFPCNPASCDSLRVTCEFLHSCNSHQRQQREERHREKLESSITNCTFNTTTTVRARCAHS